MIENLKMGTGGHPINLKPRQISTSNYELLESLTGMKRKSLYKQINKYKLNPSNYADVSAYIYMYMEKRIRNQLGKERLNIIFK